MINEKFIKVTADPCNPQGTVNIQKPMTRDEFLLNVDLIGAIQNQEVFLKGDNILQLGKQNYTNFRLIQRIYPGGRF